MKLLISKSALALMIFSNPSSSVGGNEHPIHFLKNLYSSQSPLDTLNNGTVYIDIENKNFESLNDENSNNPGLGIFPQEALPLAIKHIESQWTPSEVYHLFKDLTSVRFIRCGKSAVVFNLKENKRYVVIFNNNQLIQNFFEGEAA